MVTLGEHAVCIAVPLDLLRALIETAELVAMHPDDRDDVIDEARTVLPPEGD